MNLLFDIINIICNTWNVVVNRFYIVLPYLFMSNLTHYSIQYVYVNEPNDLKISNALAFTDPKFAELIDLKSITDYDTHFEKDFIKKVEQVTKPLNWNIHRETETLDVW